MKALTSHRKHKGRISASVCTGTVHGVRTDQTGEKEKA